jgi:hypothetical protein
MERPDPVTKSPYTSHLKRPVGAAYMPPFNRKVRPICVYLRYLRFLWGGRAVLKPQAPGPKPWVGGWELKTKN